MSLSADERKTLDEIHGDVRVLVATVKHHDVVLFGPDRRDGAVAELQTVRERQEQCPARRRATRDNRMFVVALIGLILGQTIAIGGLGLTYLRLRALERQTDTTEMRR